MFERQTHTHRASAIHSEGKSDQKKKLQNHILHEEKNSNIMFCMNSKYDLLFRTSTSTIFL